MRRFVLAVGFLLAIAVVSVQAQGRGSFPGCPTCGVWSWVDYPVPDATVSARHFVVAGWGFECESGQPVDRVDVYYQDYEGVWIPIRLGEHALQAGFIARPDVVAAFAPHCPNVVTNTGWALQITGMPLGLRRLTLNVWRGPYMESHQRTYLVKR